MEEKWHLCSSTVEAVSRKKRRKQLIKHWEFMVWKLSLWFVPMQTYTRKRASLCQEPNGLEATLMIKLIIPYSTQNDDSSWLLQMQKCLSNTTLKLYIHMRSRYPSICYLRCLWINHWLFAWGVSHPSIDGNWFFFVHKCPINHQFRILITYRKR